METEIQMQNHKVETNSELIYEDGTAHGPILGHTDQRWKALKLTNNWKI